jgi:hypothetical protein
MNSDYTDNGADLYINAGQAALDRMQNTGKMRAKNVQLVTAGTIKVYVAGLRSVLDVWIANTTEKLCHLKNAQSLQYLYELYGEELEDVTRGTPTWYCPAIFRPFPDTITGATLTSAFEGISDLVFPASGATSPTHYTYDGIVIMPPPDVSFYVGIHGLFYSPALSATLSTSSTSGALVVGTSYNITTYASDDDFSNVGGTNVAGTTFTATGTTPTHWAHASSLRSWINTRSFWSEVHPNILLKASLKQLEMFYRNTEGVKDWDNALKDDIIPMDMDAAEEEAAGISQMGG